MHSTKSSFRICIAMALSYELALKDESKFIKCVILIVPMIGDFFVSDEFPDETSFTEAEKGLGKQNQE